MLRLFVGTLVVFVALGVIESQSFAASSGAEWTIVDQGENGVTVSVDFPRPLLDQGVEGGWTQFVVPGAIRNSEVGAPDVPSFLHRVAVPPGRDVSIRILDQVEGPLLSAVRPQPVALPGLEPGPSDLPISADVYEMDSALYGSVYPQELVSLVSTGRQRFLNIATFAVHPYQWIPAQNGVRVFENLTVRIDFVASPEAARSAETLSRVDRDHQSWDSLVSSSLLNAADAPAYRTRPTPVTATRNRVRGGDVPEYRMGILESGIQVISFDDLPNASAGPVQDVAIYEKAFAGNDAPNPHLDTPSWVDDRNDNGQFDAGDRVYFYGLNYPDRFDPEPRDARYGDEHAYWLAFRGEGGVRTAEEASFLGRDNLTPETTFESRLKINRNKLFRRFLLSFESGTFADGTEAVRADHAIWLGIYPTFGTPQTDEFDVPGFVSANRLVFEMLHFDRAPLTSRFLLRLGGAEADAYDLPETSIGADRGLLYTVDASDLSQIPFRERDNYIGMSMEAGEEGAAVESMVLEYERSFRAFDNRIPWDTDGLQAEREYVIDGFNSNEIVVFDVSDPLVPVRLTYTPEQLVDTGNGSGLRLQFDLSSTIREFEAVTAEGALRPASIELRDRPDVWDAPEHDYTIIVHNEFRDALQPYVADRIAQGWSLNVVEMRDLADEFDHGRSSPLAIRRYLRYLFASLDTPPSFLMFVGDASEDHRTAEPETGRIFVPTQTIPANSFLGTTGRELAVSDHWFVDDLVGESESLDFFPDMHVGRLPVKSVEELEVMVEKIKSYEQFRPDDAWRSRVLFVADDEYSTTLANSDSYKWRSSEQVFRRGAREATRIIHDSYGFESFQVDSLYLATYLDSIPCAKRCFLVDDTIPDCADQQCVILPNGEADIDRSNSTLPDLGFAEFVTRTEVMPTLRQFKNLGYLMVAMQSHANRNQVAHEALWRRLRGLGEDQNRLENVDKPFIYLGFGCHMSEFGEYRKGQTGNSLVEAMMYLPNGRGAIAGIASNGYEWLRDNDEYQLAMAVAWFQKAPADASTNGRARWMLGEMYTASKLELLGRPSGRGMIPSYSMLGDPTMTVEIGAPRVQQVFVNGTEWQDGGTLLAEAGTDSLVIQLELFDESWIETVELFGANGKIPSSEYDFFHPGSSPDSTRRAAITYRTTLDVPSEDYDILVRGTDRNGLTREVAFPVILETKFETERDGARQPLEAGQFVAGRDSVFVTIASPVELSDGLSVRVDGNSVPSRATRLDADGYEWELAAEIPLGLDETQDIRLSVGVQSRVGSLVERSIMITPATSDAGLVSMFNFPNPFDETTEIFYTLSGPAVRAEAKIYTLRGREIQSMAGPARLGENTIRWDGTDADGDQVANGVYFYKLEVETADGKSIERIERIARVR